MARGGTTIFERLGPAEARTPLVIAVPHAGRLYPAGMMADCAVPRAVLEQLEDRLADLLAADAVADGAVAIVARVARAWIDLNRAPDEVDPASRPATAAGPPASARVRNGLGLVPRRLGARELWRRQPAPAAIAQRLALAHQPYHRAVADALAAALARHGHAVLIDCHSMPALHGSRPARIVIGDRHGRSAAAAVTEAAVQAARAGGHRTGLNLPYAGAYTLDRHGQPAGGVHALQVEVDRSLYLDPEGTAPSSALPMIAALVARISWAAVAALRERPSIAAE